MRSSMRQFQLERLRFARRQASVAEPRPEYHSTEPKSNNLAPESEGSSGNRDEVLKKTSPNDPKVVIEPQDTVSRSNSSHQRGNNELYSSEAEYRSTHSIALRVQVISINGLDGKHAWRGHSLSAMSLDSSEFTFDSSLVLDEDSPETKIQEAASKLLDFVTRKIDETTHEDIAIVFIARDIGGTLLKQALISAFESPEPLHERIIKNTTHLLFFGTPHRASEQLPWDYTISNLIYQKAQGTSSRWLPNVVRRLAIFHQQLADRFESVSRQQEFRYVNYYQEESKSGYHSVVIPQYAATFGYDGERQIGREESHGTLANLSQPDIEKDFLSMLQDANAATRSEYRESLSLLSRCGLGASPPRVSRSTYMSLCDVILSTSSLFGQCDLKAQSSLNTITAIHQGHAWDSELRLDEQEFARKPEAVARSIQIVDLEDCVVDTAALSSSLMTSILQKQPRSRYRFITLVNYPPRRVPATKLQLLVSLAHQYLTHYPRVFRRVQPVFKNVQESMKTSNTLWKEICLERLIKTLLRYHGTDLPFIIIVRPDDEKSDGPVHEVTSNLLSWVSQSEIYAKILVVRYHRPQPGNLGIGTASDIRTEGFRQRNALRKDHESEMKEMLESNRRLSILRPDLTRMLEGIRIMTPSQWIPIFENLLFASTSLANIVSHASKNDQDITDLMLDTVAESTNPWIKSCLGWITHAVRPLSYAEFQAILIYETGTSNHGDFSSVIVEELRKLLPGLVETDGDVIYLARSEIVALLTARLLRQRERRDSTAGVSGTQFDDWNHTTCHPDLYIARYCIRVLRDSFNNEASESKAYADVPDSLETVDDSETDISASEEEMKEKVPPPMLSYAAEHWLTHVQLWIDGSETPSEHSHEEDELKFITEFLHDSKIVNWWLRYRRVHKGKDAECGGEYDMVQAADILSLNPRTRQGALKLATTVQLASDNRSTKETGDTEEPLASIFITSAQLGDSGILAKMDGGMLEEILPKIFQTGADTALCSLAEEKKEFVRRNWWTAMNQAIRMGNLGLFYKEGGCANSNFEPSIWYEIAEHGTYLPEDALKSLKSVSLEVRMEILRLAATSGHSALVQKLIEAGLQPNQGSSPIDIPLFMAAQHGHYQIVGQLLAAIEGVDASVGRMEASHLTPLHTASASGYRDIVGLLLAHSGAAIDLSSQDRGGNTALHLALANGHEEVAVSLLMARQEPPTYTTVTDAGSVTSVSALDSQNLQLHTPLMSAVQSGYLSVVKILLDRKVNVNLADEKGKTALHYAAALEMHEILSLLLGVSGVDLEARDSNNTTPLHEASSQGRPENVKMLLKYKADHTAVDDKDRSPLELASEAGHTVTAKILLPLYGRRRITASFLRAVSTGNVKMAELLMDAGADINAVMPQTQLTALHQGAARSDARLVQSLLLRKAELNPTDQHGRTPLYEAASRGAVDCLKLLVDAGADINVPDSSGVTAMFAAATENYERCVDILLAAPIQRSTQEKNVYRLDAILRTSASVLRKVLTRISGDHGEWDVSNFALQQLLESGTNVMEVLSTLLDYGLKHEEIIGNYGTMLHYAVYQDQPDIVSLLAKDGRARPGVLYAEHGTPLQIAAHYAKPNALAIVKILLHEGAEATLGSDEIGSPLHAATAMAERSWYDNSADARYLEIAQAIIDHEPSTVNKVAGAYPTVLQSAVRLGTVEMVQLILENHPDMSIVEGKWGTPLHLAVHFGFWRELELILSCNDCDLNQGTRDKEGRLPLHMLPRNSYWGMSDYDMLKGDEEENRIREVDNQQRHMVHFCAGLENDRLLELVLIHQPEALEKVDIDGWTPLHWACRHRSYDTIRLLLDRQANKNAVTYRGWRPIDVAKYHGLGDSEELNQLLRPDSGASNTEAPIRCLEGISYDDEEAVPVTAAPRHYGYTCDSCGCQMIYGPRYRCDKCNNFDMCFKCFRHVRSCHYKHHTFQKFQIETETGAPIDPWKCDNLE